MAQASDLGSIPIDFPVLFHSPFCSLWVVLTSLPSHRCAIYFYQICLLAVINCHTITTTMSQPDLVNCGELQQCNRDPQNNDYCYLFTNVSTNDLAIRKTINIHSPILRAYSDDQAVKVYWNTTNIILEVNIGH